jgi:hypothetical protein
MPSWPNLRAVAAVLGVTVASLLADDEDDEERAV